MRQAQQKPMLPGQENRSPIHNLECGWDSQPANYKENQQVIRGIECCYKKKKKYLYNPWNNDKGAQAQRGKNVDYMQKKI